ncbi:16S rRNA (cytosine(967)-C(5))-methyltransferase RsmB [Tepidibacter formicigenes]|jgi:16S rRNA (cytosine967-C5)-methyltransferase|uniref:16S rRNA (cytosine(967)-C(5))-methyltransferase n=1 Tax=Tepidibacter formicigenes DSM 15518 TaxID=1123349 RepID=A0A1M6KH85_9FIRM|nr:16S rRNA (cytosine(967)-C(5))-methyltransferase RsmB [Tepidibacter formicigenes]SHJ58271.1 16S rRNA (cytosine967-C5)-methyltransferase [Tepidibacter formicigenes DSM 15518]
MKNAREIALNAIYDIENKGLYSNIGVNKYLKNSNLKDIDRGFVTEIIYGVVENRYFLNYVIDKFSSIKSKKLSPYVRIILQMGIYQILFLDSVTDFAAVNESVNLAKKYYKKASGFVNGVLRNIVRNQNSIKYPDKNKDLVKYLSVKYSYEKWIVENWIKNFGKDFVEDLLEANNEKPSLYLRTNTLKISRDELIKKLKNQGIECEKAKLIEEAIVVKNLKNIENNKLFKLGYFQVQDISSMIIGHVINPNENSLILDVCSAPGGKTTHLATLMENTGQVVARDIFDHKLKLINENVKRLGLSNVKIEKFDALNIDKKSLEKFDYVLVDAPCSGFGIIRRKPEIKYKDKKEVLNLPKIQKNILKNSSKYVKKGGLLVYSTCTIEDRENIDIIKEFLKENDNFKLEPITNIKIDLENQENGYVKIYPHIHGMDGFFIAKIRRVR